MCVCVVMRRVGDHHVGHINQRSRSYGLVDIDDIVESFAVLDHFDDDGITLSQDGIDISPITHLYVEENTIVLQSLRRNAECRVVTTADRILALAMARHVRLGADSPAKIITRDVLMLIAAFIRPREHLLICGGRTTWSPGRADAQAVLSDAWDLDLWSGTWRRLPDLPRPLADHCCAWKTGEELWVLGGVGNHDAYIYSVATGEWYR